MKMNNWLIISCAVVGIAAGALYNTSYAQYTQVVEHKIVNAGLYKIKGGQRVLERESRMTEQKCIDMSRSMVGLKLDDGWHLEVVCKTDPVVIKKPREFSWP